MTIVRKSIISIVFAGLLAPTIGYLCQSQCHFMSGSDDATQSMLASAAGQLLECCANQPPVLKKPIAELTANFQMVISLATPTTFFSAMPDKFYKIEEGPPGPAFLRVSTTSFTILRV